MVNTVLAGICAKAFKTFADTIEAGAAPKEVAQQALKQHWKVIFNGNGYDPANQKALTEAGLWRFDSGVDAICRITEPKNVALFEELKILSPAECQARQVVMLNQYIGTVEIEVNKMSFHLYYVIDEMVKSLSHRFLCHRLWLWWTC